MRRALWMFVAGMVLLIVGTGPAIAVGPVDGEVELLYWGSQTEFTVEDESLKDDSDAPGLRGEVWFAERFGLSLDYLKPKGKGDVDGLEVEYVDLDFKFKVVAPARNSFFAIGLGWENIDISAGDSSVDTSGLRVVVDGRIGVIGLLYFYGRGAYMPSLADIKEDGMTVADSGKGYDADIGVGIEPIPLLSVWVGYRVNNLEFNDAFFDVKTSIENAGPYLGVGIHF